MPLGIIGAGNVGCGLGAEWPPDGHDVCYRVPDPGNAKYADLATRRRRR
jgi:predicted dinucleotide-binding enzyme